MYVWKYVYIGYIVKQIVSAYAVNDVQPQYIDSVSASTSCHTHSYIHIYIYCWKYIVFSHVYNGKSLLSHMYAIYHSDTCHISTYYIHMYVIYKYVYHIHILCMHALIVVFVLICLPNRFHIQLCRHAPAQLLCFCIKFPIKYATARTKDSVCVALSSVVPALHTYSYTNLRACLQK